MHWKKHDELAYLMHQKEIGNDKPFNDYINEVFVEIRRMGFPHFSYTKKEKNRIMEHLKSLKTSKMWSGNIIRRNVSGYGLANSYHPQMQSVRSHTSGTRNKKVCRSPMDVFNDDKDLIRAIKKCLTIKGGPKLSLNPSNIRNTLKFASSHPVKRVSNFSPAIAKAIYERYTTKDGGVIYDPSMGYGGRIMGAMSTHRVKKYIGTDPCSEQHKGLNKFLEDFPAFKPKCELIHDGSENIDKYINDKTIDLIFTSPPYFNCEIYSDEPTQSWKKYNNQESWMNGFMKKTMENCKKIIKDNGYIIINIANVATYKNIEEDFVNMSIEKVGLKLVDTLKLELANIGTISTSGKSKGPKFEPIFVFQKDGANHWAKNKVKKNKLNSFVR